MGYDVHAHVNTYVYVYVCEHEQVHVHANVDEYLGIDRPNNLKRRYQQKPNKALSLLVGLVVRSTPWTSLALTTTEPTGLASTSSPSTF